MGFEGFPLVVSFGRHSSGFLRVSLGGVRSAAIFAHAHSAMMKAIVEAVRPARAI